LADVAVAIADGEAGLDRRWRRLTTCCLRRGARPDAAAGQAAHDVLTALYPPLTSGPDRLLAGELAAIPETRGS
jgi:hypothetical protein